MNSPNSNAQLPENWPDHYGVRITRIQSGETKTAPIDVEGWAIVGLITPDSIAGNAITLEADDGAGDFNACYDEDGNQLSIVVAASRYITLDPIIYQGFPRVKLVTNGQLQSDELYKLIMRKLNE